MSDFHNDWQQLIQDVDGFWNEESKSVLQGRVVSIVTMNLGLGETLVAIVSLTAPCKAVKGSGEDKEEIELKTGQAIGVVIKHKLTELESFVENQNEIRLEALKKLKLEAGKSMWTYRIQFKGRRTLHPVPRPQARPLPQDPETEAKKAMEQF